MKELSLYFLDIVKNSTAAGASLVKLNLTEDEAQTLTVVIGDDGRGMSPELSMLNLTKFIPSRSL